MSNSRERWNEHGRKSLYRSWQFRAIATWVTGLVVYFLSTTDQEIESPIVPEASGLSNEVLNIIPNWPIDTRSISVSPSSDQWVENEVVLDPILLYNIYSSRNIAASGSEIQKLTKAEQKALFIELKEKGLLPFIVDALQYFDKIWHKEVLELIFWGSIDGNTDIPWTLEALINSGKYQPKEVFDFAYDRMGTNAFRYIRILSHNNPEQFIWELMKDPKLTQALPYIQDILSSAWIEDKISRAMNSWWAPSQDNIWVFKSQVPISDSEDPVDFTDMNWDFSFFTTILTEQDKKTLASQWILQKMLDAKDYITILENSTYFGLNPAQILEYANYYFQVWFSDNKMYRFIRLLDSENSLWIFIPSIIQQIQNTGRFRDVFWSKKLLDAYGRQKLFDDLFGQGEYILLGQKIFILNPSRDSALLLATKLSLLTKDETALQSNTLGTVWSFLRKD